MMPLRSLEQVVEHLLAWQSMLSVEHQTPMIIWDARVHVNFAVSGRCIATCTRGVLTGRGCRLRFGLGLDFRLGLPFCLLVAELLRDHVVELEQQALHHAMLHNLKCPCGRPPHAQWDPKPQLELGESPEPLGNWLIQFEYMR